MRLFPRIPMQVILACALGIFSSTAAFAGTPGIHSRYVGTYESDPVPDGTAGPSMAVSLGSDGSATVTQDPGKAETTSFGRWTDNGGQVVVTFDAVAGQPAEPPMTFQSSHDGLQAVTWNHARWGKINPPLAKKSSGNWHSGHRHFL
jgi:hypothetical protein